MPKKMQIKSGVSISHTNEILYFTIHNRMTKEEKKIREKLRAYSLGLLRD